MCKKTFLLRAGIFDGPALFFPYSAGSEIDGE